jgi:hypothetical protein
MSTRQGRRRKKVESVGINDVGTTPTRARFNVLADVSDFSTISTGANSKSIG